MGAHPFAMLHPRVRGSLRCDCGEELEIALRAIAEEGCGLVIYEHQEARGIGLMAKLQAYAIQDGLLPVCTCEAAIDSSVISVEQTTPTD